MFDKIFFYNEYNRNKFIEEVSKKVDNNLSILDVGAGPCKYRHFFSHCNYKAHDFSKYEGEEFAYGELDYISDITNIPVENNSFDVILCTEVLEHVPKPDLAIGEFTRILKSNGLLVLTAPLGSSIHMAPYHYYGGFSPFWYKHFLAENNFTVESIEKNGRFFKLYGQESQRFLAMLTPHRKLFRLLFFPIKLVLAIWFRLLMPIICHLLDRIDTTNEFTAGYFVIARKR